NYFWDFGDGTTGTGSSVQHIYTSDGVYNVQLIIENVVGCRDTIVKTSFIQVADKPVAQFVPTDNAGCAPFATTFTNTTIINTFPIASYAWDFGNGQTSNLPNPGASYPNPGVYTVQLVATDQNGCADTTTQTVEAFTLPVADFTSGDTLGCAPNSSVFVSTSTGNYAIASYLWDFGDGNTSTQQFPTYLYVNNGSYDVSLQIEDVNGCRDTIVKPNYVRLTVPTPGFTVDTATACPGTSLSFTDTSIPDHPLTDWLWDFGDGNTSTDQNPTHVYAASGFYDVTLTVTNVHGCSESITQVQFVEILSPPTAQFTLSDPSGCVPFTLNLLNTSVGNSGTVTGIQWDFGNGDSSTLNNPVVTYPTSGIYNISLTVTDDNGCTASVTESVNVFDGPTASFFTNDVQGCPPHVVSFTNTSTGPVALASYEWNFGLSGGSSTLASPSFIYADTGSYTVSLVVEDVNGCRDTIVRTDYIRVSEPVAEFTATSTQLCEGEQVTFTNTSTGDTTLISYAWDFGDGTTATGAPVQHIYATNGTYTVRLIIENIVGCRDTIVKTNFIQVADGPNAQFTLSSPADCAPFALSLTNTSVATTFPIAAYAWDFGNGDSSNALNPSTNYPTPGTYTVQLVATDQNGCSDTTSQRVESYSLPFADFQSGDTVGCAPQSVAFVNTSGGANGLANFVWDFGDGGSSTAQFPTHLYLGDGIYDVKLWVEDVNGCQDSITKSVYIRLTRPSADFTVDTTIACPGTGLSFSDNSTPDTTLVNWAWDFGDGNTASGANVSHVYATSGVYTVTLTVTNILGCEDVEVKTAYVNILTPPTASFIPVDSQECTPLITIFNDASTAGDGTLISWNWDLGNGSTSSSLNPTGIYPINGTYTVSLTVIDDNGCSDSYSDEVTALTLPIADFAASDTLGCSEDITFTDLTISPYNIVGWKWYFGDGDSSTQQTPTHTYFFTGSYSVTLIVFDEFGCTDTIFKPNYVNLTRPVALFAQDQDVICPGTEVSFFDFSVPDFPIIDWSWDFGDGGSGSGQFPT
ncbi:MAG: PKD domain-containing protein, partial [Bacteroidota bacterium]